MTPSPAMPGQAADAADARKAVALLVALLVPALTCACASSFPTSSSSPGQGAALTGAGEQASETGRLAGLNASEVIALVGVPAFRLNDPPAPTRRNSSRPSASPISAATTGRRSFGNTARRAASSTSISTARATPIALPGSKAASAASPAP